jgi:hypothetical protein
VPGQVFAARLRDPYLTPEQRKESEMNPTSKSEPGIVGYALILVIFVAIAAPALLPTI